MRIAFVSFFFFGFSRVWQTGGIAIMSRPRHAALRFPKNLRHLLASFAGVVPALVAPLNERRPHLLLQVSKELERGASENNEDGERERERKR